MSAANNDQKIESIPVEPYCNDLFTAKTIAAIATKTPNLIHQYNMQTPQGYVRYVCKVLFLGYMCTRDEIPDTMEILANKINELAEKDYILASLVAMTVVPMADPNQLPALGLLPNMMSINGKRMYAVLSYLAVPPDGEEYIKKYMPYLEMPEGGIPKICTDEPLDRWENFNTYALSEE